MHDTTNNFPVERVRIDPYPGDRVPLCGCEQLTVTGHMFLVDVSNASVRNPRCLGRTLNYSHSVDGGLTKPFPFQRISSHSPLLALSVKSTLHLSLAWWLPCVRLGSCCYCHHFFFSDPLYVAVAGRKQTLFHTYIIEKNAFKVRVILAVSDRQQTSIK